jgi:hypothetical protein
MNTDISVPHLGRRWHLLLDSFLLEDRTLSLIVLTFFDICDSIIKPLEADPTEAFLCWWVDVAPFAFMQDCILNGSGIVLPNPIFVNLRQVPVIC